MASMMLSKIVSTIVSDSLRGSSVTFNTSSIKSYGPFDMAFLKKDVLPNVTTLIVSPGIKLPQPVIDDWHRQGKKFVAEVGINNQSKTGDEHFKFWTGFLDKAPFLDGIIINEFGMNRAEGKLRPERLERAAKRHKLYEDAFTRIRSDDRYKDKAVFAYFGGSANVPAGSIAAQPIPVRTISSGSTSHR